MGAASALTMGKITTIHPHISEIPMQAYYQYSNKQRKISLLNSSLPKDLKKKKRKKMRNARPMPQQTTRRCPAFFLELNFEPSVGFEVCLSTHYCLVYYYHRILILFPRSAQKKTQGGWGEDGAPLWWELCLLRLIGLCVSFPVGFSSFFLSTFDYIFGREAQIQDFHLGHQYQWYSMKKPGKVGIACNDIFLFVN